MKKSFFVAFLATVALLSISKATTFAFGMPKMNVPGISIPIPGMQNNSACKGQITTINASMDQANIYMNNSIYALSVILLNKNDIQKFKDEKDAILSNTKSKEKQADLNKITTTEAAFIQTEISKNNINAQLSQLSS